MHRRGSARPRRRCWPQRRDRRPGRRVCGYGLAKRQGRIQARCKGIQSTDDCQARYRLRVASDAQTAQRFHDWRVLQLTWPLSADVRRISSKCKLSAAWRTARPARRAGAEPLLPRRSPAPAVVHQSIAVRVAPGFELGDFCANHQLAPLMAPMTMKGDRHCHRASSQ